MFSSSSLDLDANSMDRGGDDWDLAAVVRSCCCSRPNPPPAAVGDPLPASSVPVFRVEERGEVGLSKFFPDLFTAAASTRFAGLEDLYTPFPLSRTAAAAPAAAAGPTAVFGPKKLQRPASQAPRPNKRRKKQLKKVVRQVPADGVSSDMWAWRKYGQKPIKGSPYPRGYYRCSSYRGCPARKQVERNRADPGLMIITYTSEHNHPFPARHVFPSNGSKESADQPASSPVTSASVDGDEGDKEEEEEGAILMVEDMEVLGEDEFVFVGDADAAGGGGGGGGVGLFVASPWLDGDANSSATAAAC